MEMMKEVKFNPKKFSVHQVSAAPEGVFGPRSGLYVLRNEPGTHTIPKKALLIPDRDEEASCMFPYKTWFSGVYIKQTRPYIGSCSVLKHFTTNDVFILNFLGTLQTFGISSHCFPFKETVVSVTSSGAFPAPQPVLCNCFML